MHPKLERAMPLLEHLASGGKVIYDGVDLDVTGVVLNTLLELPKHYTIHREPKAVFITVSPGGSSISSYDDLASAMRFVEANPSFSITRYVEDLTWKPS